MLVYRAQHVPLGRLYIGQSGTNLKDRIAGHYHSKNNTPFGKALRSCEKKDFVWAILGRAKTQDKLNKMEKKFIKVFRSDNPLFGFNSTKGGAPEKRRARLAENPISFRPAKDMRAWLTRRAKRNGRNLTNEIIFIIEKERDSDNEK